MLSGLKRFIGNITVTELNGQITIDGIPADVMTNDIYRLWKTSRINANMFTRVTKNTIAFSSFFAVDVLYMLEQMIEYGNRRVSARTLTRVRDLLLSDTWLTSTVKEHTPRVDLRRVRNLIYTPTDFQQRFLETYDNLTQRFNLVGYLLAATAGSGKTYTALALAEALNKKYVIIVCPKNATERVWESEIKGLYRKPQTYWIAQHGKPYRKERFLVFHYEALGQAQVIAKALNFDTYRRYVKQIQRYRGDARQVGEEIKWVNAYERSAIHTSLPKDLRNPFKEVKSIIKYVNLKIQGEALGRILGRKRTECHVAMVPSIDFKGVIESTAKKTVVFTSFVPVLESMMQHLTEQGFKPQAVYGKTNADLNRTIQQFETNENVNPLGATYQSLSTAVPLVMADTMIMIDAPFRAYIHEQAVSRIHRLGATTQTHVWECHLDTGTEPNISTRSSDILEWSQRQVSAIMGIDSPFEIEESVGGVTVSNEAYGLEEYWRVPVVPHTEDVTPASLMW